MISRRTILRSLPNVLKTIDIPQLGKKYQGKVRDFFILNNEIVIVTTDRISAFDVILGYVPFKGAVLNLLAGFWFDQTKDVIPNHLIKIPDPNVMVVKNATTIPIEMVVRGYITGVTGTSIWGSYAKGEREIYGIKFPEGLKKNQKLLIPVITPTTKAEVGHDERLTEKEILEKKLVDPKIWKQMKKAALELFDRGTQICKKAGIILVDTKYEFGLLDGKLILIDEIHTPDSSRFWVLDTYQNRFEENKEPENFDKEFLRLWYAKKGYIGDGKPPEMSEELIINLAQRYVAVYEKITGKKFKTFRYPIEKRIQKSFNKHLSH